MSLKMSNPGQDDKEGDARDEFHGAPIGHEYPDEGRDHHQCEKLDDRIGERERSHVNSREINNAEYGLAWTIACK
jgi:hypothetical protein